MPQGVRVQVPPRAFTRLTAPRRGAVGAVYPLSLFSPQPLHPRPSSPVPKSNTPPQMFFYTYVLRCADGQLYVGSTNNLKRRLSEHQSGRVPATSNRQPAQLEYYEACRNEASARLREKQLNPCELLF